MSPNDITFIIPVFNLDANRLSSFKFILNAIHKTGSSIIIVEQFNDNSVSDVSDAVDGLSRIIHKREYIDDINIHKSRLINLGVDLTNTKFVWVNDVDCYLKFASIINDVPNNFEFIQPYCITKLLNATDSDLIKSGSTINIDFNTTGHGNITPLQGDFISLYGALSFIADKEAFMRIGGMCEEYTGWGLEDDDLCYRAINGTFTIMQFYGIHFYHPPVPANLKYKSRRDNEIIYSRRFGGSYSTLSNKIKAFYKDYYKKISIYGIPRSGTTYLMVKMGSALNKIPLGEPANITAINRDSESDELDKYINKIDASYDIIKNIPYYSKPAADKFKMSVGDFKQQIIDNLIIGTNKDIILTTRFNFIEWLSSFLLAFEESRWVNKSYDTDKITVTRAQFDHNYNKWYNWHFVDLHEIQRKCKAKKQQCVVVDYTEIIDESKRSKKIDEPLNLNLSIATKSLSKQKNKPGKEYISNYDEVMSLYNNRLAELLEFVIVIRFNLTQPGFKDNLDEQWLLARIELFKLCLRSLESQTDQNFKAVILLHKDTPDNIKTLIEDLISKYTNIQTYYTKARMGRAEDSTLNITDILSSCNIHPTHRLITMWHDSDDIISKTVVEKFKYSLMDNSVSGESNISCFPRGIKCNAADAAILLDTDTETGFIFNSDHSSSTYYIYEHPKSSTCIAIISDNKDDWDFIYNEWHGQWHHHHDVTDINRNTMFCKILSNTAVINRLDTLPHLMGDIA
jgi:hypothetical protein